VATDQQSEIVFDAKAYLKTLSTRPGVYRMLNASGEVIYVGKARNLAKRVGSYFSRNITTPKTRALVSQIANIDVTVTHTENEALILENNLIKKHFSHQTRFRDWPTIVVQNVPVAVILAHTPAPVLCARP